MKEMKKSQKEKRIIQTLKAEKRVLKPFSKKLKKLLVKKRNPRRSILFGADLFIEKKD